MPSCWSGTSSACMRRLRCGAGFSLEVTEERPGFLVFKATGKGAVSLFAQESGGHRWQRIPPTEKRGRVQTSTVTVAVFPAGAGDQEIRESDITWYATKGSGPGGQHKNTTLSKIVAVHAPTGITAQADGRSQAQNRQNAIAEVMARVRQHFRNVSAGQERADRQQQVGTGQRGDKIRTIRVQDGVVTNHLNGRKISYSSYSKGEIEKLHN